MTPDRQAIWGEVLDLSRRMLAKAGEGDWVAVEEKENRRRQLLETFFTIKVEAADSDSVAEGLREMLAINDQIARLGNEARQVLLNKNSELGVARRANAAYMKNT